jgi:hypothetical protein
MYFVLGLCMIAAVMVAANIVFTTMARLASFAFAAGKAGYDAIRAQRAHSKRIYHYPSSVMATPIRLKRDWENESRLVRQQVLLEGPRIWRNPSPVLKQIDWDIAIELKKQELARLRTETAQIVQQQAKAEARVMRRKSRSAKPLAATRQDDLSSVTPATSQPASLAEAGITLPLAEQFGESPGHPVRCEGLHPSTRQPAARSGRFPH